MNHRHWLPVSAGLLPLFWNGRDDRARNMPGGIYFVRLLDESGKVVASRKVVRVR